jgi:excisionase family DNA binding protein
MPSRDIPLAGAVKPACLHAARQSKQAANSNGAGLMLASEILSKRQAAEYLQVTTRYLERMVSEGRLLAYRSTGKLWRVRKSSLDAFLESGATIGGQT